MIVIKLGGSLYHQPDKLKSWLNKLSQLSETESVVIVPGGGPFADQVRVSQTKYGYDDTHAHQMALLAMAQFGLLLHSRLPKSQLLTDIKRPPTGLHIWLPSHQLTDEHITHCWDITSDSLALWLATQLKSSHLYIVKSCSIPADSLTALSEAGILDKAFANMHKTRPMKTTLFHVQDLAEFPSNGLLVS
jgi:aspartokinase-like uncharacterized kinase